MEKRTFDIEDEFEKLQLIKIIIDREMKQNRLHLTAVAVAQHPF